MRTQLFVRRWVVERCIGSYEYPLEGITLLSTGVDLDTVSFDRGKGLEVGGDGGIVRLSKEREKSGCEYEVHDAI